MKQILSVLLVVIIPSFVLAGPPPVRNEVVPAIPVTAPVASSSAQVVVPQTPEQTEPVPQAGNPKGIRIKKQQVKKKTVPSKNGGMSDRQIVEHRVKQSVQRPVNAMSVESKTIYSYVPDAIYMIYAAINHVVDIQLQPGEKLTGKIVAGDTFRWEVGTVEDGSGNNVTTHVLIKPKQAGIETNFLIVTDRHSYRLYAQSNDDFFIPTVGWAYSDEEMTTKSAQIRKEQQRLDGLVAAPAIIAANLNFRYKIKADKKYAWVPLRAFDDGSKTYIQMAPEMKSSEAPVLFIKDGKKLNLVNYRIKGDYFIVDRLFEEGELRSGKKDKVRIIRQTPWFSSGDNYPESGKGGH